MDRLLELLGIADISSFRAQYFERIQLAIANRRLDRQKRWTESIAVGSSLYVAKVSASLRYTRRKFLIEDNNDGSYLLRESLSPYSGLQIPEQPIFLKQ